MKCRRPGYWLVLVLVFAALIAGRVLAEDADPTPRTLTVAVMDFQSDDPVSGDLGQIISQTLTITLAAEPGFDVVDRSSLDRILQEQELSAAGLMNTHDAVEVGQLVGARLMVMGKAFQLGENIYLTAKIVGTETSLVDGVLVSGDLGDAMDHLVLELSTEVAERLRQRGPTLVAQPDAGDPLAELIERLDDRRKPTVAIVVAEEHRTGGIPIPLLDPAAETELKRLFIAAGFQVREVQANEMSQWVRHIEQERPWPRGLDGIDLIITGEGFSEFGSELGQLTSSAARLEINAIERHTRNVVFSDASTQRAVDLSEEIAGKAALENAGRDLGMRLLNQLANQLPAQEDDP